ncbi:MAG: septal ring lytic transglycosylase RlpA family protein [Candidatus Omnitrophota bacterium]|nr:MAG: septal ring lytic transglycosylase RlpA family protein [Candidatus Omnitrophota bacterium]
MNKLLLVSVIVVLVLGCFGYVENSSARGAPFLGMASWYSRRDPGVLKTTANMEKFDDKKLTCAMWAVPFNTFVEVRNLSNNKSVVVRVNDRGPAKRLFRRGRIIDLTKEAFSQIAHPKEGLISVKVTVLSENSKTFSFNSL